MPHNSLITKPNDRRKRGCPSPYTSRRHSMLKPVLFSQVTHGVTPVAAGSSTASKGSVSGCSARLLVLSGASTGRQHSACFAPGNSMVSTLSACLS